MSGITRLLGLALAAVATGATATGVASADVTGPQAFEFAGTCTGLGDVVAVNTLPATGVAWQVVGTNVVLRFAWDHQDGLAAKAAAAGTTCTAEFAGPPGALEPIEPVTFPVIIGHG
jgi:hypothetical protein